MQTHEDIAEPPPAKTAPVRKTRPARTFLWLVVLAIFTLAIRIAYVSGVEPTLREFVELEFRKRGFATHIGRISVNPFAGVVANDVRLLDASDPNKVVASVDRLALAIDWAALARGQTFIDHLEIRNGNITLPGNAGTPERGEMTLHDFQARILMGPSQIRLSQAQWIFRGIQVAARGTILNPQRFRLPPDLFGPKPVNAKESPRGFKSTGFLERLTLKHSGVVDVEFYIDFATPSASQVRATARLGEGSVGRYNFHGLDAEAVYRGTLVDIRDIRLRDPEGELVASCTYDTQSGVIQARVQSGIDLQRLVPEIFGGATKASTPGSLNPALLDECVFYPMPRFNVRIRSQIKAPRSLSVIGSVNMDKVVFRNLTLDRIHGDFSWDGSSFYLQDFGMEHESGRLGASVLVQSDLLRASLESSINPNVLKPLFTGRVRTALDEWDFQESPELEFELHGTGLDLKKARGEGKLRTGRLKFRGVGVNKGTSNIHYEGGAFTYKDFWIERPEGFAGGTMVYDFLNKEVRLSNVVTTIDPMETCVWIDPRLPVTLRSYKFNKPPALTCNGYSQFGGRTGQDLTIVANAPAGLNYELLGKWLPIERVTATLLFKDQQLHVKDVSARVFGGRTMADTKVSLVPNDKRFSASVSFENTNFEELTRFYFGYKDSQGLLHATYSFAGLMDDMSSLNGEGTMQVVDGDIFAIPYIGPISALLNEIIPGMGYSRASKASATFKTRNGVMHTDDFEVRSSSWTMIGGGWLDFPKDKMDFSVRVNARGMPGILLFPVSKLFEYTSTGELSEPHWRPKRFTGPGSEEESPEAGSSSGAARSKPGE